MHPDFLQRGDRNRATVAVDGLASLEEGVRARATARPSVTKIEMAEIAWSSTMSSRARLCYVLDSLKQLST